MAALQKVEGQVELNCSADELFEMFAGKQHHIPNICSNTIPCIEAHQNDWISVGTTRKWNYVIDGQSYEIVERMEIFDEENKMIHRDIIEGDIMKTHYKTMTSNMQVISKEDGCCIVKLTLEYEKLNEDVSAPDQLLDFSLGLIKDLGSHLASA